MARFRRRFSREGVRFATLAAVAALIGSSAPRAWLETNSPSSRRELFLGVPAVVLTAAPLRVSGFSAADLGMAGQSASNAKRMGKLAGEDPKMLEEALYSISRVQEATVQQERLVTTGKFKDVQRNSITMALNMMLQNYALNDQVITASAYVENKAQLQQVSQIGLEAVEALEQAKEYFGGGELKVSGISDEQRNFIIQATTACRTKLDDFLVYMPSKAVQAARTRVEEENALNMKEFVGQDGVTQMSNPVTLPWKTKKA
mmetsp:Transcript_64025/g.113885  ORF Transcript_64025/g.113885 Transcript_64025/m.113885 type:complete len:260 (-) Transcript_64025:82-861(-)|eukprot:CAMPEP_0197650324 /NCGR_PEP_ID=MMETSP1338-20131121/30872_1 /TAXON_ID=43686 ORGANISM="Pelagodinium beii, Strain RCC1491" /NCGR_SAMPLE_ID=MMETSP1338 /ASSEMBLY_ACC=CAM_ASM_000754 /LENGTH=259 /DNA_ID=CAMNT_0043224703 /DNA_START=46 /DNA_END=825 /DNA_ORIENTATION=-